MPSIKLFLVAEGVSDYDVINRLASSFGAAAGTEIEIELASPPLDETSGFRARGGWCTVRDWCKKNGSNVVGDGFAEDSELLRNAGFDVDAIHRPGRRPLWPIMLTMSAASAILVHIDADIAEQIVDRDVIFNDYTGSRKDFCREALEEWIGAGEDGSLRFIVATHCIETWFLAMHDNGTNPNIIRRRISDYESVENVIDMLLSLGYDSYEDEETGSVTVDKKTLAVKHGDKLLKNLDLVKSRCPELQRLQAFINMICG